MEQLIAELIKKFNTIAAKNGDRFAYKAEMEIQKGALVYNFVLTETTDNGVILAEKASTLLEALTQADHKLAEALKPWGYSV